MTFYAQRVDTKRVQILKKSTPINKFYPPFVPVQSLSYRVVFFYFRFYSYQFKLSATISPQNSSLEFENFQWYTYVKCGQKRFLLCLKGFYREFVYYIIGFALFVCAVQFDTGKSNQYLAVASLFNFLHGYFFNADVYLAVDNKTIEKLKSWMMSPRK